MILIRVFGVCGCWFRLRWSGVLFRLGFMRSSRPCTGHFCMEGGILHGLEPTSNRPSVNSSKLCKPKKPGKLSSFRCPKHPHPHRTPSLLLQASLPFKAKTRYLPKSRKTGLAKKAAIAGNPELCAYSASDPDECKSKIQMPTASHFAPKVSSEREKAVNALLHRCSAVLLGGLSPARDAVFRGRA